MSYNRFTGHDKTMLIGSSNTVGPDVGRLNVTLHHNVFDGTLQRLPRIRFGQVDIYNNLYKVSGDEFRYAVSIGVQSAAYLENNAFIIGGGVAVEDLLYDWGGTTLTEKGSWVAADGRLLRPASLLQAYNASHDPDLGDSAGWTPTLRRGLVLPTVLVPLATSVLAGAGRLGI